MLFISVQICGTSACGNKKNNTVISTLLSLSIWNKEREKVGIEKEKNQGRKERIRKEERKGGREEGRQERSRREPPLSP